MSRYIEYHDICSAIGNQQDGTGMTYEELAHAMVEIQLAPSIDIVRCAECVYCNIQNTKYLYAICERHGIEFKPFEDDTRTHGCAWGERKESE